MMRLFIHPGITCAYLLTVILVLLGAAAMAEVQSPSTLREYLSRAHLQGRFAAYTPNFHIKEFAPGKWWIYDGTTQVAVIDRQFDFAELINFDPYHPLPPVPFPKIHHAPTMPGDRITMAKWINLRQATTSKKNTLTFAVTPSRVTATFTEQWDNGRSATSKLSWQVDADLGYIIHCEEEMHFVSPGDAEYCNFLPKGTTDDRPEFKRYSYTLWEHPSGKIMRWNQNNMGAMMPSNKDQAGQRRVKTGGFIGFFGEKDRSPALELLESTPDSFSATCPNMLDEHLTWLPGDPAQGVKDSEGRYVSRAVFNIVSLPPEIGLMLTPKSTMLDLYMGKTVDEWGIPLDFTYWGFTQGVPTDFEIQLDPHTYHRGVAFKYHENADEPVTVVSDSGHSGTHSLRLRADGAPVQFVMDGGSVHVTEGKHYHLYAWIKTDLTDGQAVLKANECLFTFSNITAAHKTAPITGKSDWQQVALDFTPGDKAHVVLVTVNVSGHGTVWVDDLLLMHD